jgi:hypothetical protein
MFLHGLKLCGRMKGFLEIWTRHAETKKPMLKDQRQVGQVNYAV